MSDIFLHLKCLLVDTVTWVSGPYTGEAEAGGQETDLSNEFEASLGYMEFILKQTATKSSL